MKQIYLLLIACIATLSVWAEETLTATIVVGEVNCVDSLYNVDLHVEFSGYPEKIRIVSDFAETITQDIMLPPFDHSFNDLLSQGKSLEHTITISLYEDVACSQLMASRTISFTEPNFTCYKLHVLDSVCLGDNVTLSASCSGEIYEWSDGATSRSITTSSDTVGTQVFSVKTMVPVMVLDGNLMANGGFESNPPSGFSSDYKYAGWDPSQYYESHAGADNLYAITHEASYFWRDFAPIKAHSGNYFALFDAGKSGNAWKATTADNPALVIEKDTTYIFSYWAAYPNRDRGNNPAVLQFRIRYVDEYGLPVEENLGTPYTLGQETDLNAWYEQTITWKSPVDCNDVVISVYDKNDAHEGNDFALDDIMFQTTHAAKMLIAFEDRFVVPFKDCTITPPTPPTPVECQGDIVWAKWNDVLFVDNSDSLYVSYQWYKDSVAVDGATGQYFRDLNPSMTAGYYAEILTVSGEKIHTCEITFVTAPRSADAQKQVKQIRTVHTYFIFTNFRVEQIEYEDGTIDTRKIVVL